MKSLRFAVLLPAVLALGLNLPAKPAQAQGQVTVLCSLFAEWCEIMRAEFEKATGIRAVVTTKSTGEAFAQLRAEADNPRTDVWWGGPSDSHLQAAELGLLDEYRSPMLPKLYPWARKAAELANYRSVGIYASMLGVVWNTKELEKRKLPVPKCWSDLVKPVYRDEIQMSNPATSGTSYTYLATMVQILGEDAAFAYFRELHKNVNQYPRSGAAPMANVVRGESVLAVTFTFAAVAEAALGAPVTSMIPCEGTANEVGSMSILKGAKNLENARKWYDFVLTPAAQATGQRA